MIELADQPLVAALSDSRTLFEVGLIIVLAAAAPLIAQVLRVPSILLLLALGFGAGAIGALDPNELLGEAVVSAIVSISVGFILFDSGLDLKLSDLRGGAVARVGRRLVTLGIVVTWAIGTVASHLLFDLAWEVALVLGAVLVPICAPRPWPHRTSRTAVRRPRHQHAPTAKLLSLYGDWLGRATVMPSARSARVSRS